MSLTETCNNPSHNLNNFIDNKKIKIKHNQYTSVFISFRLKNNYYNQNSKSQKRYQIYLYKLTIKDNINLYS